MIFLPRQASTDLVLQQKRSDMDKWKEMIGHINPLCKALIRLLFLTLLSLSFLNLPLRCLLPSFYVCI